jgi:hypothetical protein
MRRVILAVLTSAAAFGSLATTSARAMPIAPPAAPSLFVRVDRVCNSSGWCWFRPNYYRPHYGYRYYRYDDYYPFRPRGYYDRPHYWGGYGGWHRRWEDDDEQ